MQGSGRRPGCEGAKDIQRSSAGDGERSPAAVNVFRAKRFGLRTSSDSIPVWQSCGLGSRPRSRLVPPQARPCCACLSSAGGPISLAVSRRDRPTGCAGFWALVIRRYRPLAHLRVLPGATQFPVMLGFDEFQQEKDFRRKLVIFIQERGGLPDWHPQHVE
jgi:hypothetical protein